MQHTWQDEKCTQNFSWKTSRDPGAEGRIILNWMLKKLIVKVLIGFSWLRIRTSGELLSPSCCTEGRIFTGQLKDYHVIKKTLRQGVRGIFTGNADSTRTAMY
jgi:hypothetical protein